MWDGDHLAAEIQMPGGNLLIAPALERDTVRPVVDGEYFGRVLYLSGPSIDQPLSLVRIGYGKLVGSTYRTWEPIAISPRWDHQGRAFSDVVYGPTPRCQVVGTTTTCLVIGWPARLAYGMYTPGSVWPQHQYNGWYGSLAHDQLDGTGQLYRRNRYYDPASGRFTQEDPIGLAGGVNAYGFAEGDPVSFSDPYGLCVIRRICEEWKRLGDNAVLYWADRSANGNWLVRGFAQVMGPFAALCTTQTCDTTDEVLKAGASGNLRQVSQQGFNAIRGGVTGYSTGDPDVDNTIARIQSNSPKFRQDGTRFQNREGRLPTNADPDYYKEWTVETPGLNHRGLRRIVVGKAGEMFYSTDHYTTFTRF